VANVLRNNGYRVAGDNEDEFSVFRDENSPPYSLDLVASNSARTIAVEIDGYRGHKSRRRILYDAHRTNELKTLIKDLEVFRFAFWQLKGMDDGTIAEELQIH
jgi:very-short-patch-repair endonuclease